MSEAGNRGSVSIGPSKLKGGLGGLPAAIAATGQAAACAPARGCTPILQDADVKEISIDRLRDGITTAMEEIIGKTGLKRLFSQLAGQGAAPALAGQSRITMDRP